LPLVPSNVIPLMSMCICHLELGCLAFDEENTAATVCVLLPAGQCQCVLYVCMVLQDVPLDESEGAFALSKMRNTKVASWSNSL
jgi:hypothetical protein